MILRPSQQEPRRGVVLLAVLVVLVLLTLAAYQYNELMLAENRAAYSYTQTLQARALAESGVHYTAALIANPDNVTSLLGGNPISNPTAFQNIPVGDATPRQGRFSVVAVLAPDDPDATTQAYRFGLVDEAGKINLNALMLVDPSGNTAYNMLMTLPNMTDSIANAIVDWMDPDDTPRSGGAESDTYSTMNPPYSAKNGPLDSIEELLFVQGVTPQLLFGNDRNRNGVLDPGEDDGQGVVDQGWAAYLTVYSREPNVSNTGTPRVYLNDPDLNTLSSNLSTVLTPDMTNFIIAYRMYGAAAPATATVTVAVTAAKTPNGGNVKGMTVKATTPAASTGFQKLSDSDNQAFQTQLNNDKQKSTPTGKSNKISSIYDLMTAKVNVQTGSGPNAKTISVPSPLSDPSQVPTLLPLILDQTTTTLATDLPPRININTAPPTVLAALPGIADADVQAILDHRPDPNSSDTPDPTYQTPAWLITQANLSSNTLKTLENYITARSQVYRFQVVGYFDGGGPTCRLEAVVDGNGGRPRIVYMRPLDNLGKGFDPNLFNTNN
jgi:type II secretory pathway component PulK